MELTRWTVLSLGVGAGMVGVAAIQGKHVLLWRWWWGWGWY
jgi:hypothetical protein